jgi:hypothetical protein
MDAIRCTGSELVVRSILVGTKQTGEYGKSRIYVGSTTSLPARPTVTGNHLEHRLLRSRPRRISQIIQQSFRRDKIGSTKALREPTVDRPEAVEGFGCAALVVQRAGEARRRAQLPRQRLLPRSLVERLLEVIHCFCDSGSALQQKKLAFDTQ